MGLTEISGPAEQFRHNISYCIVIDRFLGNWDVIISDNDHQEWFVIYVVLTTVMGNALAHRK